MSNMQDFIHGLIRVSNKLGDTQREKLQIIESTRI